MTLTYGPTDVTAEVTNVSQTPIYDESGAILLYTLVVVETEVVDGI